MFFHLVIIPYSSISSFPNEVQNRKLEVFFCFLFLTYHLFNDDSCFLQRLKLHKNILSCSYWILTIIFLGSTDQVLKWVCFYTDDNDRICCCSSSCHIFSGHCQSWFHNSLSFVALINVSISTLLSMSFHPFAQAC